MCCTKENKMKCLNPWDPQSKRQYQIDGVYCALNAGQAIGGQAHGICYCFQQNQREEVRNMGEQAGALTAEPGMHNNNYLCYCIEGNVVDRVSSKNGKGYCENVSPTLNTQDRHAVCFQLCGDRNNPSVSVSDTAYCIPANPMSDRGQAVCYEK